MTSVLKVFVEEKVLWSQEFTSNKNDMLFSIITICKALQRWKTLYKCLAFIATNT